MASIHRVLSRVLSVILVCGDVESKHLKHFNPYVC